MQNPWVNRPPLSALVGEGDAALSTRHSGCPGLCDSKDRGAGNGRDETLHAEGGVEDSVYLFPSELQLVIKVGQIYLFFPPPLTGNLNYLPLTNAKALLFNSVQMG